MLNSIGSEKRIFVLKKIPTINAPMALVGWFSIVAYYWKRDALEVLGVMQLYLKSKLPNDIELNS